MVNTFITPYSTQLTTSPKGEQLPTIKCLNILSSFYSSQKPVVIDAGSQTPLLSQGFWIE